MIPHPNQNRYHLEDTWRLRLEEVQRHYRQVTAEYRRLLTETPEGSSPEADSRVAAARQTHSEALAEYTRVLRIFNELILKGKPPEEQSQSDLVVVIDDDKSVRNSLKTLLRSAEYRVATFESAESFLASGAALESGCLILDIRMPGMGGLDLQASLHHSDSSLPIIFITGHDDGTLRGQALQAGAVELLRKPFPPNALLSTVQQALASRAKRKKEAAASS